VHHDGVAPVDQVTTGSLMVPSEEKEDEYWRDREAFRILSGVLSNGASEQGKDGDKAHGSQVAGSEPGRSGSVGTPSQNQRERMARGQGESPRSFSPAEGLQGTRSEAFEAGMHSPPEDQGPLSMAFEGGPVLPGLGLGGGNPSGDAADRGTRNAGAANAPLPPFQGAGRVRGAPTDAPPAGPGGAAGKKRGGLVGSFRRMFTRKGGKVATSPCGSSEHSDMSRD